MPNYCSVPGCRRNNRANKYLFFFCLPKVRSRQKQWLRAIGKEDMLDKGLDKLHRKVRVCSRHFLPKFIKNRHLTDDAVPSKCLPGSISEDEADQIPATHEGIICDNCLQTLVGFRYKCVTCDNYDLCQKCEMLETHSHHYMLRIPCSLEFDTCDDLISKWRQFFKSEHIVPKSELNDVNALSSDDEPVTKYIKKSYTAVDISEDVKKSIQNEVDRALKAVKNKKRSSEKVIYPSKKIRMNLQSMSQGRENENEPEVGMVYAEDNVFSQHDIKTEGTDGPQPEENDNLRAFYLKMGIDLSQLMTQVVLNGEEPS